MTTADQFTERAEAVAARVVRVHSKAEADDAVARERERAKSAGMTIDVVAAAHGIAATGTCVVVTDDEAVRLATMLPEVSVLTLNAADIVPDLPDIAPFLRERQSSGHASYTSFITGPSRTADIERVSAIGVHGPLELVVILVEG
jgi:L-lactate dehydrogenase complex protein LldG